MPYAVQSFGSLLFVPHRLKRAAFHSLSHPAAAAAGRDAGQVYRKCHPVFRACRACEIQVRTDVSLKERPGLYPFGPSLLSCLNIRFQTLGLRVLYIYIYINIIACCCHALRKYQQFMGEPSGSFAAPSADEVPWPRFLDFVWIWCFQKLWAPCCVSILRVRT